MSVDSKRVTFAHNFGGRAAASHLAAVIIQSETGMVLHTIPNPSEFRVRENGTVTIYSRKHPSTSVYGLDLKRRVVVGVGRSGRDTHTLTF